MVRNLYLVTYVKNCFMMFCFFIRVHDGLILVLKAAFFFPLTEEPWDTEWAEPEGLAAHAICECRLCFLLDVHINLCWSVWWQLSIKMARSCSFCSYDFLAVFLLPPPVSYRWFLCVFSCASRVCLNICICGLEGFPLWFMTWPRPHLELSLAITT